MEVYLEGNFWGHQGDEELLRSIPIYKDFVWEKVEGKIPAVYIGSKGVVLDICTKTSVEEVRAFMEKYPKLIKNEHLSNEEYERIENENPIRTDFKVSLSINGKKLKGMQSCGLCWYPTELENRAADSLAEELMKEYQCDRNYVWSFKRTSYQWEEKMEPSEIILLFQADKMSVSGEHFTTKSGCEEQKVLVKNPVTGKEYEIIIYRCEPKILENVPDIADKCGLEFPTQYHELEYFVEPEKSDSEFRIVDCKDSENARKSKQKFMSSISSDKKASTIAIIGGVNGPTSIFLAGKLGASDKEKHRNHAFSSMYFERQKEIEWRPVFKIEEKKDMEFVICL